MFLSSLYTPGSETGECRIGLTLYVRRGKTNLIYFYLYRFYQMLLHKQQTINEDSNGEKSQIYSRVSVAEAASPHCPEAAQKTAARREKTHTHTRGLLFSLVYVYYSLCLFFQVADRHRRLKYKSCFPCQQSNHYCCHKSD